MLDAAIESALDRPVWSALTTGDRRFAEGGALALRFPRDIAPFGATADESPEALEALRELVSPEAPVALVGVDKLEPYPGFEVMREAPIIQMIADGEGPPLSGMEEPVVLGPADVPEMLRLAKQTNPGPFGPRTQELGQYIGVRVDGGLAAMAGERMRLDGWVEISAVCVSPGHRGKGYGAFLVSWLVRRLRHEGAAPFLHVFTDNLSAIALYQRLGFKARKTLRLTVLSPASAPYSRPRLSPGPASASARPTSSPRSSIEVCSRTVRSSPFA
ncbi:MAG TPA: GNAT family N-acetyltransferase [Roseiarcus sp.]|jgi:predicted GNAT family acetyltransferase